MTSELKPCKNCGSLDQSWQDGKRVTTGVSHNRLNLNDVEAFFFLGCNACGETLRYMSCEAISEQLNTRSTPSADTLAGLVRYGLSYNGGLSWNIGEDPNGKYVLYSEAAAVVATKDAEVERLNKIVNSSDMLNELAAMLYDAQQELAQIKAQEPMAVLRYDRSTGNENEMPKVISCNWIGNGEYYVYAAPASDGLKEENERLRLVIERTQCPRPCNGRSDEMTVKQCISYGECSCVYGAALNVEDSND